EPKVERRQRFEQAHRQRVAPVTERDQRAAGRQAERARRLAVPRGARLAQRQGMLEPPPQTPVARAGEREHRMDVVETAEAVVDVARPRVGEFAPALTDL